MDTQSTHRKKLLDLAKSFMHTAHKSRPLYEKYSTLVRHQIAIIEQTEGRPLQKKDWMDMAIKLGTQALTDDVGARQIAESIYPILDRSGQDLTGYATLPAESATSLLLWITGLSKSLDPTMTRLMVQVVGELQGIIRYSRNPNAQPK